MTALTLLLAQGKNMPARKMPAMGAMREACRLLIMTYKSPRFIITKLIATDVMPDTNAATCITRRQ